MRGFLGCICVWALVGCGPTIDLGEGEASAGSGDGPPPVTTSATSTSTSGPPTASATFSTGTTVADDSGDVLDDGPFGWDCGAAPPGSSRHCIGVPPSCDPTLQELCPDGERCVPTSDDGQPGWDTARCVPVVDVPGLDGDPCTIAGDPWSGQDTCDVGSLCVAGERSPNEGTCWPLCSAQGDGAPTCSSPDATCAWLFDGVVPVCAEVCDPLVPACTLGRCDAGRGLFECVPWPGAPAALGEPCSQPGECEAGATCVDAAAVPGCAGASCCSSFCDLLAPDPSVVCAAGQACEAWFPAGAPAGYDDVGVCSGA